MHHCFLAAVVVAAVVSAIIIIIVILIGAITIVRLSMCCHFLLQHYQLYVRATLPFIAE